SAASLPRQVLLAVATAATTAGAECPPPRADDTLWTYFHRRDTELWSAENRLLTPVLVFDRFEVIFTFGREAAGRAAATESLLLQLGDLIEGRVPDAIKAVLEEHPDEQEGFDLRRHRYRVVLSLREEYVLDLQGLRARIPSLGERGQRLLPMTPAQAGDVVLEPGGHLVDRATAEEIVRFVAAAGRTSRSGEPEVEPALLSLVCRRLNDARRRRNDAKITSSLLQGTKEQILED